MTTGKLGVKITTIEPAVNTVGINFDNGHKMVIPKDWCVINSYHDKDCGSIYELKAYYDIEMRVSAKFFNYLKSHIFNITDSSLLDLTIPHHVQVPLVKSFDDLIYHWEPYMNYFLLNHSHPKDTKEKDYEDPDVLKITTVLGYELIIPKKWEITGMISVADEDQYYEMVFPVNSRYHILVSSGLLLTLKNKGVNIISDSSHVTGLLTTPLSASYTLDDVYLDIKNINEEIKAEMNKKISRPSWNDFFMNVATSISSRSTCDRLHVGCVLVKENRMIAQGYNGSIAGHDHCDDVGHLMYENGCKRTIHAEQNAIAMCARMGISSEGATAYVTDYPCPDCMKLLNQAGIKKVIYKRAYKHRYENDFGDGMEFEKYDEVNTLNK